MIGILILVLAFFSPGLDPYPVEEVSYEQYLLSQEYGQVWETNFPEPLSNYKNATDYCMDATRYELSGIKTMNYNHEFAVGEKLFEDCRTVLK